MSLARRASHPLAPFAVVLALAAPAAAGDAETPTVETPEIVIVTAPRLEAPLADTPAATTVVEGDDLERASTKTINAEEALKLVPGVKVDNQADGERVHLSIRGEGILTERGIRRIMVLLDGIPLNDPLGLAPDLFDVDWAAVRRVEVLRGPASALYGAAAGGGVIDISTRDGGPEKASGGASLALGSYGFRKLFAEAGGTAGTAGYRVSASRMQGDGYRVHTAYDATNAYAKVSWGVGPGSRLTAILASTRYFNENAEGLSLAQAVEDPTQANPDAVGKDEYQDTRRTTLGLTGSFALSAASDLSFGVYARITAWRESVPASVIDRTYDNPGGRIQYVLRAAPGKVRNEVGVGIDAGWQSVDEQKVANPLNADVAPGLQSSVRYDQQGLGAFAVDRLDLGRGVGLVGGLRWDGFRERSRDRLTFETVDLPDFEKITGRVGATWNPDPRYGLYASWGQGYLPPSTEELINNPDAFGGYNTHLAAATSSGEEVGVRGAFGDRFAYDAALFHLDTADDFGRYRVAGRELETFYYNAGSSRRNGLETSLGWRPVEGLSTRLAYTASDFRYTHVSEPPNTPNPRTYHGTRLPSSPEHQGFLDVEYRRGTRWLIGGAFEAQSRSYVDPTNASWAWGYGLVHLRAACRWGATTRGGDVSVVVRNVFDRKTIAFVEPDPDGNSYHPAATREVLVSARFWLGPGRS